MSRLWVYAVTGTGAERALGTGMTGEALELLEEGPVAAIFGRIAEPPAASRQGLEGHDGVVRRLAAAHDSLLPARFGQALEGEEALRRELAARAPELCAALGRVAGCVQMTLRLFGQRPLGDGAGAAARGGQPVTEVRRTTATEAPSAGSGAGTHYLAQRRLLREQRHRLPELQGLLAALAPMVREQRIERQDQGPLLGSAYHLVPRERVPEYRRIAARHRGELLPARVSVSGPSPAWAFEAEGPR